MRYPCFVLEVVLVAEGRLDRVQIAGRGTVEPVVTLVVHVVLEHHRLQADALGEVQQLALALRALETVEFRLELGLAAEAFLVGHDRQAEVDRQDHDPKLTRVLGHEVVQRRADTVAWPALLLGVAHRRVETTDG